MTTEHKPHIKRRQRIDAPDGMHWATGGGSIAGCNGNHLAPTETRGTLCGLYGPATPPVLEGSRVCGTCARIAGIPKIAGEL